MKKREIIRVEDVMLREFDIVKRLDTIREALESMRYFAARTLIVDKRDENDEYGIVDFGSIARQVLAKDRSPDRVNIYEIMTKPTLNAPANMDIRYCARMFERFSIHRAPVVKDGKIVGIISYEQMLQHWLKPEQKLDKEQEQAEVDTEKVDSKTDVVDDHDEDHGAKEQDAEEAK